VKTLSREAVHGGTFSRSMGSMLWATSLGHHAFEAEAPGVAEHGLALVGFHDDRPYPYQSTISTDFLLTREFCLHRAMVAGPLCEDSAMGRLF
jgi:hypothetical protein